MHRTLFAGVVALLTIAVLGAQGQNPLERDILKLENDWSTADQKKDVAFLQRLFADEFLSTDQDANTYTKSQALANVTSSGTSLTSFALTDMKVHVYADTAVVRGLYTNKSTFKGKYTSGAYRFTDVFVKRDGRWQAIATQSTMVGKK